jgi:hypothetical protein
MMAATPVVLLHMRWPTRAAAVPQNVGRHHQQFLLLIRIWLGAHDVALEPLRCQVGQCEACLHS